MISAIAILGFIFFVTAFIVVAYLDYKTFVMKLKRHIKECKEKEEKVE